MIKNKVISVLMLFLLSTLTVSALELKDITAPKGHFYRFGTSEIPETKYDPSEKIDLSAPVVDIKPATIKETKPESLTYADLSIKSMAHEISKSIELDYNDMLADLSEHRLAKYIFLQSEELTKKRFLNTETGLMMCVCNTTGWSPLSPTCQVCKNVDECKVYTKKSYPELYRIRIEKTKN